MEAPGIALVEALSRLAHSRDDREAWGALYVATWPFVMSLNFRGFGGQRDLAEDASQEVFCRLISYCSFDDLQTPSAFLSYLRVVCGNVTRSHKTRTRRYEQIEAVLARRRNAIGHHPAGISTQSELLGEICGNLTPTERELLKLVAAGLSTSEIAQKTGVSYSGAAVRCYRLRQKIAKSIKIEGIVPKSEKNKD